MNVIINRYVKDDDIKIKVTEGGRADILFVEYTQDDDRDIPINRDAESIDKLIALLQKAKEKLL